MGRDVRARTAPDSPPAGTGPPRPRQRLTAGRWATAGHGIARPPPRAFADPSLDGRRPVDPGPGEECFAAALELGARQQSDELERGDLGAEPACQEADALHRRFQSDPIEVNEVDRDLRPARLAQGEA